MRINASSKDFKLRCDGKLKIFKPRETRNLNVRIM